LSARLTCTHGSLPEDLRLGDINQPTDKSPARIGFRNITSVTPYSPPVFDSALLWRVLSHLNANHLSMAHDNQLQDLLSLYLPSRQTGGQTHAEARRVVESIERIDVQPARRIVRGMPVHGSEVVIACRGDHFPGQGSLFLFGTVLDELLAGTTALNTFSALTLEDTVNGETLKWPAKIGRYRLLETRSGPCSPRGTATPSSRPCACCACTWAKRCSRKPCGCGLRSACRSPRTISRKLKRKTASCASRPTSLACMASHRPCRPSTPKT